jgi:signal peptidase II
VKKISAFLFVFIVFLDQMTKFYIKTNFALYESKTIVKGLFNITYVLNPGAAFGFLANLPEIYRRGFFITITIIAIIIIFRLFVKEADFKLRFISYTLILSGAVGNFIDRLFIGKVVDFLDFYIKNYHWPAFNVADSAISVGIFLLIIDILFVNKGVKDAG